MPVRRTFGLDGKVRPVAPVRNAAPVRKNAPPTSRNGTSGVIIDEGFGARKNVPGHATMVLVDRFGVEIPPDVSPAFTADAEMQLRELLNMISKARVAIEKGHKTNNPLYANIAQRALIELDNAYSEVKFGRPYCVCRICQGNGRGSCTACHETGFQTQAQYDNNPKEFKAQGGAA